MQKNSKINVESELERYIELQLDSALTPEELLLLKRNADALRKVALKLVGNAMTEWSGAADPEKREMLWHYQNAMRVFQITLSYFRKED